MQRIKIEMKHRNMELYLRACEECAREDEGTFGGIAQTETLVRRHVHVVAVRVVHLRHTRVSIHHHHPATHKDHRATYVAVLEAAHVLGILVHGDFRAIEDGRLVHVVPDVQRRSAALVLAVRKLLRPPAKPQRECHVVNRHCAYTHHWRTRGSVKSGHALEPGQHQPTTTHTMD